MAEGNVTMRNILITTIIIGMSFTLISLFIYELGSEYSTGTNLSSTFKNTSSSLEKMQTASSNMEETLFSGRKPLGILTITWEGATGVMNIFRASMGVMKDMMKEFSSSIGIPQWFLGGIISIFVIVIVFLIIRAFAARTDI